MRYLKESKKSYFILIILSFFAHYTSHLNAQELSSEELGSIMMNEVALSEMQSFVSLADGSAELIKYQNDLQFQINALALVSDDLTQLELSEKLKAFLDMIFLKENDFTQTFSKINQRSQSDEELYYPLYRASYLLVEEIFEHAKKLSRNSEEQIQCLLEVDCPVKNYDLLTAKSYLLTADFLLITAKNLELNSQFMPDFNLSKILVQLDIFGSLFMADVTRLTAFYLQSELMDPGAIVNIHAGIYEKLEKYNLERQEIQIKLKSFINEMNMTVNEVPELISAKSSIQKLDILSIKYISTHKDLVNAYLELADLYLIYKDDLEAMPDYATDAVNAKIEESQIKNISSAEELNATLIVFQNLMVQLLSGMATN